MNRGHEPRPLPATARDRSREAHTRARAASLAFTLAAATISAGSSGCAPNTDGPRGVISGVAGTESGGAGGAALTDAGANGSAAAGGNGFALTGHGLPGAEPGTWTYLLYMIADNPLEPFMVDDLSELMQVGSEGSLTILAQIDRAPGQSDEAVGGVPDFTDGKRLRIEPGRLVELEGLGEVNSGSVATFSNFVSWGIRTAPADHYALILWDHGGAWGRFGADVSNENDGLSLEEMTRSLDVTIADTGLRGPIDLIGFDACLMGTWEVAVELAGRARYLLASEEVEPGHGWNHQPIAVSKTDPDPVTLGSALIAGYAEEARQQGTLPRITLALTDLNRVSAVSARLLDLTGALSVGGVTALAPAIGRSRATSGAFGSVPRGLSSSMTDLRLWSTALANEAPEVAPQVLALQGALDDAVVDQVTGEANAGAGGLSIYFPVMDELYDDSYDDIVGVDAWRSFVGDFHQAGNALTTPPVFSDPNGRATIGRSSTGLSVSGRLLPGSFDNVASTTLDFGVTDLDGTVFFLGEQPASVSPSGVVSAGWDGRVLQLTQEGLTDYVGYLIERTSGTVDTLSIPLEYTDDDEVSTVVLLVAVDAMGSVLSQGYYSHVDGAWAEHVPAAGSTLATIVPTRAPGQTTMDDLPQSTTFDGATPIALEYVRLDTGTNVFVRLRATDWAGNTDSVDYSGIL
jgi:hypothetical protein